jgi:hypothetical protein
MRPLRKVIQRRAKDAQHLSPRTSRPEVKQSGFRIYRKEAGIKSAMVNRTEGQCHFSDRLSLSDLLRLQTPGEEASWKRMS